MPCQPIAIDRTKLQAETARQGRAGQVRKSVAAAQFDSFLLSFSGGARAWLSAAPDDVVDWFCFLDTQGKGTTLAHDDACPGVGSADRRRCRQGATCATRYAADSLRKGFSSKLKMPTRSNGRGEE